MRTFIVASVVGVGIGSVFVYALVRLWNKKMCPLMPEKNKWKYIGKLKEITMFAVKSCHGLELDFVECDVFGIKCKGLRDRSLFLLDDGGNMYWADAHPQMLSIRSELTTEGLLRLSAPGLVSISLNIEELNGSTEAKVIKKKFLKYCFELKECETEHHRWFSQAVLGKETGLRLFLALEPQVSKSSWHNIKTDIMPYMVIHDRSVAALNNRLSKENQVHHQQFRGNFLVETEESIKAFDEDNWMWLRIGEDSGNCTILCYNSPCLRCIMPNIDINTCRRNPDFEPLATLKKFRLRSDKKDPEMGIYFKLFKAGVAKTGDRAYVQYKE